MLICQSCKENLPETGAHCPNCGAQTKCKGCQNLLTPLARFCAECGVPVEPGAGGAKLARAEDDTSSFNTLIYEDKTTRFSAKLSDNAFHSGSDVLGAFLLGRMNQTVRRGRQQGGGEEIIDIPIDGDGDVPDETPRELPAAVPTKAIAAGSESAQLNEIFRLQGNELRIKNSRLKQKTRADFVMRATVLFLYAHELAGRELVPRQELNAQLLDAKTYSGTERGWIANTDLLVRDGDNLGLSVPGREQAVKFLEQVADLNLNTIWTVGTKGSRRTKGTVNKNSDNAGDGEEKQGKGRKTIGTSYRAQVRKLFTEGFFIDFKTGTDAKVELEKRGYKFPIGRINGSLVSLAQADHLVREKNATGEWLYKNK